MNIQDQNSPAVNDELIISTEDKKAVTKLYIGPCFGATFFAVMGLLAWLTCEKKNLSTIIELLILIILCLGIITMILLRPLVLIRKYRGIWYIRPEGIRFIPVKGLPIFLKWDEVKRVKWVCSQIILEGEGKRIGIARYEKFHAAQFKQARERIQRVLSPYFNLTYFHIGSIALYEPRERSKVISFLLSFARMAALAIVGSSFLIAGCLAIRLYLCEKLGDNARWVGTLWLLIGMWLPIAPFVIMILRKHRRLSPVWRERIKDVRPAGDVR